MDNDFAITADSLYGTRSEEMFQGITSFIRRKYTRDLTGVDVAIMGIPLTPRPPIDPALALDPEPFVRLAPNCVGHVRLVGALILSKRWPALITGMRPLIW